MWVYLCSTTTHSAPFLPPVVTGVSADFFSGVSYAFMDIVYFGSVEF